MQHRPYLPGQPIATDSRCALSGCEGHVGAGHILLECTHADMKKQHIARHDAMMRMLIKEFTKGAKGSHYLIADVGTVDTLKDIGVHSKRVPKFVLPDSHIQHNMESCGNHLTCTSRFSNTKCYGNPRAEKLIGFCIAIADNVFTVAMCMDTNLTA